MKKVLALVLAVMLALSFAACGGEKKGADGDVTITWYVPGDKQADIASVLEEANKITMEKLGVKLDIQFMDLASFTQRMTMNFASGSDEFDLTFTGYINPYRDAVIKGAYLEISDFVKKSKVIQEQIPEYARECSMVNGELYGLPNMQIMTSGCGLFIQKDLAEEYGLKVEDIKHLEDIEPFLEWVKNTHPEIYPFRTGRYAGGLEAQKGRNGDVVTKGVTVRAKANGGVEVLSDLDLKDETEEALLMRKWFEKGYIRADVASAGDDTQEHAAGKFAVWRSTYKPGGDIEFNNNNPDNPCVMALISDACLPYNSGYTAMTAINANSKHPEEAFKVFELMHSDKEFYNLICYGIEGKHYNFDEEGRVVYIENSGYKPAACWKFGSVFNSYLLPGQPENIWEETVAFNDSAIKSAVMGFSFDQSKVKTEVAQIATVKSKYKQSETGAEALDAWYPAYLSELEAAGVETVKAEVEKQLNEWMKAKK